jgi:energy-coupling factor transport system ATP-binding protein
VDRLATIGRIDVQAGGAVGVVAHGASFRYAGATRPAIRDVSFALMPGECLLVLGPSGSGKSTLALALAGLVPHELPGEWHGRLLVDTDDVATRRPVSSGRVGLLFQDPDRQLVMDRAEDDVAFGLENRGWPRDDMRARVPQVLADVGLAGFEARRPARLSGGEQQRLALAGVLAPRPGLLVLDEPTANLDPEGADLLMRRIAAIRDRRTATIVLVEHEVELAWPFADRVLVLGHDGSPIAFDTPGGILAGHAETVRGAGVWLPGDALPAAGWAATGPSGETIATIEQVSFGYDPRQPVVVDASLRIDAGERLAIVGRNGSGKSTLGQLLVGLLRPGSGRVRLGGTDPAAIGAADLARRAGYAFQDPERQFLATTVDEEVRLGLRPRELADLDDLMARLRLPLDAFGSRTPYGLSGGEQRRLSLACILARRPDLLVLDEPTFGQDRQGQEAILGIVRDRVDAGTAVVVATHDRRFAAAFARRSITMDAGRVLEATDGRDTPTATDRPHTPMATDGRDTPMATDGRDTPTASDLATAVPTLP